jgi:hypothetical protein
MTDAQHVWDAIGAALGYHNPARCALRGRPHDGPCPPPAAEPDLIVLRAYPGAPPGFMPPGYEGRWFDRASMPVHRVAAVAATGTAAARPTGRFEVRDDGAVAEVWEVHPA